MTRSCHRVAATGDNIQVQNLLASVRDVMEKSSLLYQAVSHCLRQPGTRDNQQRLAQVAQAVTPISFSNLRENTPGQAECKESIENFKKMIDVLDRATIAVGTPNFPRHQEMSGRDLHKRLDQGCRQLIECVTGPEAAGKRKTENFGHRVLEMMQFFEPTVDACLGAASCAHSKRQRDLLTQCRTATEANIENHADIDESGKEPRIALNNLLQFSKEIAAESDVVSTLSSTVSGIICDSGTTIIFVTVGSLHPDVDGETFSDRRDATLKTAKALVEDTKAVVSGAASSQEQLAVAAQNADRTIVQLSDVVKAGAAALTTQNSESQVLVINAVKDVTAALSILIQVTKNASGKLLKTVKTVEDEHQRGTRALGSVIEAIEQVIRAFDLSDLMTSNRYSNLCSMQETRPVTDATAKIVVAGQSCRQDDVIAASNCARKVVSDLLTVCKAAACSAESPDVRYRCMYAGREVAIKVRQLLQSLHTNLQRPGTETKDALRPASRSIAQTVTELMAFAELFKGSDWVDPSDPTVVAERELSGAASSIEAATRKLASYKPRSFVGKDQVDTASLNFDEQILEAAKSIANAMTALVEAASAAQRELACKGRIESGGRPGSRREFQQGGGDDDQWSEGLISAARIIAAAVHSLCEAANALFLGDASEEKLISAAKQVAASTAHLLVACKVKADMNYHVMHRLQTAGSAIKKATEDFINLISQAIEGKGERSLIISNKTAPEGKYLERRRKNNESSKRSRDSRRGTEQTEALRAACLAEENVKLRAQIEVLKVEIDKSRALLIEKS